MDIYFTLYVLYPYEGAYLDQGSCVLVNMHGHRLKCTQILHKQCLTVIDEHGVVSKNTNEFGSFLFSAHLMTLIAQLVKHLID